MPDRFSEERLPGEHSPYWIRDPLDIRQQLRILAKQRERLRLWHGPDASIVTTVLDVGARGELWLDVSPDRRTNDLLLAQPSLRLAGNLDGVDLLAPIGPLRLTTHQGLPAFACDAPLSLHRLQRREFHRMPLPAGHKVRCTLPAGTPPQPVVVELLDLSLGGLCLIDPAVPELVLHNGAVVRNCTLAMDGLGEFTTDLEVRHVDSQTGRNGHVRHKVGCHFVRLTARAEQLVQRCITQLELDRRALSG